MKSQNSEQEEVHRKWEDLQGLKSSLQKSQQRTKKRWSFQRPLPKRLRSREQIRISCPKELR